MPPVGGESPVDLYYGVILADLPNGWWRFRSAGPTDDDSGNLNTLTAVGTPTSVAPLIYNSEARDFNGTTQAYTAVDSSSLDLGDSFSLEAWVKCDSVTGVHHIFSKGTNACQLVTNGTTFQLSKEGVAGILATTGITLAIGTIYHVVATKDGATSAKIYVNGVNRSGTVTNQTCADTAIALHIARKSDSTEYFDGVLDELAVYPYPLTADMILTHYNAGLGTFGLNQLGAAGASLQPTVKVEVAFASVWNSAYPLWEDVTADLRYSDGCSITLSGRADETQRPAPGYGKLTLSNRARQYDPTYTAGPHGSRVIPMRPVRVRAGWSQTVAWLHRGWSASWPVESRASGKDVVVTVELVDWFAKLAGVEFPAGTSFAAQLAGARVNACLDLLSVPAAHRNIAAGTSTMPALAGATGSILDHVLTVADSDGGFFYSGSDGRATYESRTYRFASEATSRATFGDGGVFPSTSILDSFNRANQGPPPTGWTGNFKIISNQLAEGNAGGNAGAWSTLMTGPDVEAYITLSVLDAGEYYMLCARADDSSGLSAYTVSGSNNFVSLTKRVGAGWAETVFATWYPSLSSGDKVGIRCVGSQISAWIYTGGSWTRLGEITDTTFSGNAPNNKLFLYSDGETTTRYDDFGGGVVGSGTPPLGANFELPYANLVPSADDAYLFNQAQVTSGDSTGTAEVSDSGSVAEYGPITLTATLLTGFNEAQAAGEWYVSRFREPDVRFLSVELQGAKLPATLWPKILGAYNSNRFTFVRRPLGGGTMTQDAFVERISHEIKGGAWRTTWMLSPHGDEDPWILGTDVLGTGTTPTW